MSYPFSKADGQIARAKNTEIATLQAEQIKTLNTFVAIEAELATIKAESALKDLVIAKCKKQRNEVIFKHACPECPLDWEE